MTAGASFGALTEGPGGKVSSEGAAMLHARYRYAAELCRGRRVLEVGCGPGVGLGLLAEEASSVVGGDFDGSLLGVARETYGGEVPLLRLDVQHLPFTDGAFDAVLFFEGSYYVPDMERAFDEVRRVLSPGGLLLFVNANPERPDFIRSPLSHHYHTADEFRRALSERGFHVRLEGAFPAVGRGRVGRAAGVARRALERLGLVPRTLAGRALLKRLVYGPLVDVPARLSSAQTGPDGSEARPMRSPLPETPARDVKVIYVTATLEP